MKLLLGGNNMGKGGAFFAGALCGVVAGIFLAPKPGADSRAEAAEQLRSVLDQGQDYYQKGVQRFHSSVSSIRPSIDQKNDQLQAKIDAARKIISEQVAKNATEAAEAATAAEEAGVEVSAQVEAAQAPAPVEPAAPAPAPAQ